MHFVLLLNAWNEGMTFAYFYVIIFIEALKQDRNRGMITNKKYQEIKINKIKQIY